MDYKKKLPQYLFARWEDRPSPPFIILPKFLTIFHPPPQHCVWGKEPDRAGPQPHVCAGPLQLTPPASKA